MGMVTIASERRWQAEADMRTLVEAQKIQADPKRLAAARKLAKQQVKEVAAVATPAKRA